MQFIQPLRAVLLELEIKLSSTDGIDIANKLPKTMLPPRIHLSLLPTYIHILGNLHQEDGAVVDSSAFSLVFDVGEGEGQLIVETCLDLQGDVGGVVGVAVTDLESVLDVDAPVVHQLQQWQLRLL